MWHKYIRERKERRYRHKSGLRTPQLHLPSRDVSRHLKLVSQGGNHIKYYLEVRSSEERVTREEFHIGVAQGTAVLHALYECLEFLNVSWAGLLWK